MLESAAAIATAVSAVIGIVWGVAAVIRKKAEKKKTDSINSVTEQLKQPLTPEERQELQDALNKLINS